MKSNRQRLLQYRAGPVARDLLRREGLHAGNLGAVVGPASGPKWLVLIGLDRALLRSGLLGSETPQRPLLAGASAGAWRMLALASPTPEATLTGLFEGYVRKAFTRDDTPETIGHAYRDMLAELFPPEVSAAIVDHPWVDVGIHVARARGRLARHRPGQAAQMALAAAGNLVSSRTLRYFFERCFLVSSPERLPTDFRGTVTRLDRHNLLAAARATGAVPIYLESIDHIPGLGSGVFIDGGVTDYHLDQRFVDGSRLVLLPHYQRHIAPSWFDKRLRRRVPRRDVASNVLQIYPSQRFIERLPGSRIPDRDEFTVEMDRPERRIARWRQAAAESEALGEEFLADLEAGRLADLVEPLES